MAKKKLAPRKGAAAMNSAVPEQVSAPKSVKKNNGKVVLRIEFVMGILPTRTIKPIIWKFVTNYYEGRVLDQRTETCCGYRTCITEAELRDKTYAISVAFEIYREVAECSDRTSYLRFFADDDEIDVHDDDGTSDGTDEMILILAKTCHEAYCKLGGKLGRLAFIEACLSSSGGVERIYVEEGLTPSWQQLGAWYYEQADPGSTG